MKRQRWFLPETPDLLGALRRQLAVTGEGLEEFASWAGGDASAADRLRDTEHRGDAAKRELLNALRDAFVTPIEPEDLFTLSRGIDWLLDYARDLVNEADAMACEPDSGIAEMAALLVEAAVQIDAALERLGSDPDAATRAADGAIEAERRLERVYYAGMAALLEVEDERERIARRELYRRCARIGETVIDVAERIAYAVVKES